LLRPACEHSESDQRPPFPELWLPAAPKRLEAGEECAVVVGEGNLGRRAVR